MTLNNSKHQAEMTVNISKHSAEKKINISEYLSRKGKTIRKYFSPAQLILFALLAILIFIILPKKNENRILPPVRVGWQPPWTNQGQIAATLMSSNILENNGLKGDFIPFSYGRPMIEAALRDSLDILFLGDQPAIQLISAEPRWVIVARLPMYKSALLVRPNSTIKDVHGLKGKRIYTAMGSSTHREALRILTTKANLDRHNDFQVKQVDQSKHWEILSKWSAQSDPFDTIDCLATYDPAVTFGVGNGVARVIDSAITPGVILMRTDYIEKSWNKARNFLKSYLEAYWEYIKNPGRADSLYNEKYRSDLTLSWYEEISACEPNMKAETIEQIDASVNATLISIFQENVRIAKEELDLKTKWFEMKNHVNQELLISAEQAVRQGWFRKTLNSVFFTIISFVTPRKGVWDAILGGFILTMVILWVLHMIPKKASLGHPLMVACAPIFLARSKDLWRKHFLRMDVESTFAGLEALQKMPNDVPYFAVATDVAIVHYLYKYGEQSKFKALRPLVKVKGKIKIMTDDISAVSSSVGDTNSSVTSTSSQVQSFDTPLTSAKFNPKEDTLILPDTVHEGFLLHLMKDFSEVSKQKVKSQSRLKETNSMLDMVNIVHRAQIKQWLLWEPHYMPVIEAKMFQEVKPADMTEKYEWTLWLVANEVAWEKTELLRRLEGCLREVLLQCRILSSEKLAELCYPYLFSDFTGLTRKHIENILHDKDTTYEWIVDPTKKWSTYKENLRKFADKSGLSKVDSKADERLCYYVEEYKLKPSSFVKLLIFLREAIPSVQS
ncbi:MAG: PhnD/SsuA/transferrin family substrate-binding protein [Ignavibacteriales bacterium]|nr:PhnD/SsuA/transferrin family substrate-binding protein [Ignavibacteriales bacterium]